MISVCENPGVFRRAEQIGKPLVILSGEAASIVVEKSPIRRVTVEQCAAARVVDQGLEILTGDTCADPAEPAVVETHLPANPLGRPSLVDTPIRLRITAPTAAPITGVVHVGERKAAEPDLDNACALGAVWALCCQALVIVIGRHTPHLREIPLELAEFRNGGTEIPDAAHDLLRVILHCAPQAGNRRVRIVDPVVPVWPVGHHRNADMGGTREGLAVLTRTIGSRSRQRGQDARLEQPFAPHYRE